LLLSLLLLLLKERVAGEEGLGGEEEGVGRSGVMVEVKAGVPLVFVVPVLRGVERGVSLLAQRDEGVGRKVGREVGEGAGGETVRTAEEVGKNTVTVAVSGGGGVPLGVGEPPVVVAVTAPPPPGVPVPAPASSVEEIVGEAVPVLPLLAVSPPPPPSPPRRLGVGMSTVTLGDPVVGVAGEVCERVALWLPLPVARVGLSEERKKGEGVEVGVAAARGGEGVVEEESVEKKNRRGAPGVTVFPVLAVGGWLGVTVELCVPAAEEGESVGVGVAVGVPPHPM